MIKSPDFPPRNIWFQLFGSPLIKKIIRKFRPNVIHINSYSGGILKFLREYPIILTVHDLPFHRFHLTLESIKSSPNFGQALTYLVGYPLWDYLLRKEIGMSKYVVAVSRFQREELERYYPYHSGKYTVIPNGIPVDDFRKSLSQVRCFERYTFLSGGRLFWEKGFHLLVNSIIYIKKKYRKRIEIGIYGEGPMKSYLRRMVANADIHDEVSFLGKIDRDRLLCLLSSCKAFVVPSLYETFSIAAFEAIAARKPVITLDAPYVRDHMSRGFRFLRARNVRELAERMVDILEERVDIADMVNTNYRLLKEHYDLEVIGRRYLELYREALNSGGEYGV